MTSQISKRRKQTNLNSQQKRDILDELLAISVNGRLIHGNITAIESERGIHRRQISIIWWKYQEWDKTSPLSFESHQKGRAGRKRIDVSKDQKKIFKKPLFNRKSIRSVSRSLPLPKHTVHNKLSSLSIKNHCRKARPLLNENQKKARLKSALECIENPNHFNQRLFKQF